MIFSVTDVQTPSGPGVRTDALGVTLQCAETAYAESSLPIGGFRRPSGGILSFSYGTDTTGEFATTGYTLAFLLGGVEVGRRSFLGAVGTNGVIGVRLNHYGAVTTSFQEMSELTLSAEELSLAELVQDMIARTNTLDPGLAPRRRMLDTLDRALKFIGRGQALVDAGEFREAQGEFNRAATQLRNFGHFVGRPPPILLAAAGQGLLKILRAEAVAGKSKAKVSGNNADQFSEDWADTWGKVRDLKSVTAVPGAPPVLNFMLTSDVLTSVSMDLDPFFPEFTIPGTSGLGKVRIFNVSMPEVKGDGIATLNFSEIFFHAKMMIASGCPNFRVDQYIKSHRVTVTEPGQPARAYEPAQTSPNTLLIDSQKNAANQLVEKINDTTFAFLDIPSQAFKLENEGKGLTLFQAFNELGELVTVNARIGSTLVDETSFITLLTWKGPGGKPSNAVTVEWLVRCEVTLGATVADTKGVLFGIVTAVNKQPDVELLGETKLEFISRETEMRLVP